jgi:hypothetical protein
MFRLIADILRIFGSILLESIPIEEREECGKAMKEFIKFGTKLEY